MHRALAIVAVIVTAACGDDAPSVPAEANPLGTTDNILPYPSSLYERADGAGVVLDVPAGAFPTNTIMEQVLQMGLETVDGATVAGVAVPGGAAGKQHLVQTSLHDASVPNVASYYHARSLGLELLSSSVVTPLGLPAPVASASGPGAIVVVDEMPSRVPPETNEVFNFSSRAHEDARRRVLIQQQMRDFWRTGTIANTCTGTCDCAAGNCGALRTAMYGGT